jgi:GNAT superfamily N-acetyltransferase
VPVFTIRRASTEDRGSVIDLAWAFTQVQTESYGMPERLPAIMEPRRQQACERFDAQDDRRPIWIAHQGDHAIGYLSAEIYEPDAASENESGPVGFIDELFVVPEHRGQGIATALLRTALEWVRAEAVSRVVLHVYSRNDNALRFYERMGFSVFALSLERQL